MNKELIKIVVVLSIIIIFLIFILYSVSAPKIFENVCLKNGGYFWEIQNVTCAIEYPNCALMCNLESESIGYYERGQLSLDAKELGEEQK